MKRFAIYKRCMALSLLATLVVAWSPMALAKTYLGSGGTSCAEYMAIKQALPDVGKAIELWLLGYVSGLNLYAYAQNKTDVLANQSAADVIGFVQGYCSVNENRTLNNAANEYWFQISKRYAQ